MEKKLIAGICFLAMIFSFQACSKQSKTPNGLKYEILKKGEGRAVQMNDIIEGTMTLSSQDSVLFALDKPEKIIQVMESIFPGDLNEGLLELHEGDSAVFYVPIDSVNKYMGGGLPDFVKEYLVYSIRVDALYTMEELQQEEAAAAEKASAEEKQNIARYLEEKGLKAEPTESGLYFIGKTSGTGKKVEQGQEVAVNYVGRLLNGKLFDTNIESIAKEEGVYIAQRTYEPMRFMAGVGQMIQGFDEAVLMMKKGGKATVIIPFALAYGSQSMGNDIPAFSTLVFDIELVDVK